MFLATDTDVAPWTVVKSNDKKRARLEAMKWVLNAFDYDGKDSAVIGPNDSLVIGSPSEVYDQGETPTTAIPVVKKLR